MNSDGSGYVLGAGAGDTRWFLDTRMTVKAGGAHTGGALTVIEWSAPEGFGPPRHVHHAEDEMFYVLEGEMVVECGDQRWTARPGGFAFLPYGVPEPSIPDVPRLVEAGRRHGNDIVGPQLSLNDIETRG